MPKKKQVYNSFYFFMKELEPQLRREGRIQNGMADVVPVAHPRWKVLPQEEKDKYEKMAKDYKAKMRGVEGDKYRLDNVGNIIAHRKDPRVETEKRIKKGREEVVASWKTKDVMDENFYFINFQVLCRTEEGDYLPCEIAVIEYNLKKGITKKLNRFIEPGRIPTGYRFTCMSHSEESHQIPVENFDQADENYRGLWIQLENFVNPNGEKPDYPPLYCLTDSYDKTVYCLQWICERTCLGSVNRLRKVYDLAGLVSDLYDNAGTQGISMTAIADLLTSSSWDYVSGTRCNWHEEKECNFCSLAIVQRYAYAVSDALASIYKFKLTEKHLPCSSDRPAGYITLPPSVVSVESRPVRTSARGRAWTPGSGLGAGRGTVGGQASRQRPQLEEDQEEEEEQELDDYKTRIRRPNMPAAPAWAPAPMMTAQLNTTDLSDFPALGGAVPKKFAGRAQPPDPSSAPPPPLAWQGTGGPAVGIGRGRGRGEPTIAGDFNHVARQPQNAPVGRGMQPIRPTMSEPGMAGVHPVRMAIPPPTGLMGQGRGVRMAGPGITRPPVGRGYAPPGMLQHRMQSMSLGNNPSQQ